ncbi:Trm112 family protein [Thermaurantiacus sp.]
MTLDPRLLALLVCPVTRGPLCWLPERGLLVSERAGLAFRVEDGVPILLPEEARAWPEDPRP